MADHKSPRRCLADAEFHLRNAERSLLSASARAPDEVVADETLELGARAREMRQLAARVRARLSHEPVLSGRERP